MHRQDPFNSLDTRGDGRYAEALLLRSLQGATAGEKPGLATAAGKGGLESRGQVCFSLSLHGGSRGDARSRASAAIPPSTRRDTPSPAPSTLPAVSLQIRFSHRPPAAPAEISPPATPLAASWDVEGLFSKYGWQEELNN